MRPDGNSPGTGRGMIALGGCAVVLVVAATTFAGGCMLLRRRSQSPALLAAPGTQKEEMGEIDTLRHDLLVLSGDLSDPERQEYDLVRASRHLESIEIRLEALRGDPGYLKLRALHESVKLQLQILEKGKPPDEIPPLPPATTVPPADDRYVGSKVNPSILVKGKIFSPSASQTVRYGPALFHFARRPVSRSRIGSLEAEAGWKFIDVEVGIAGKAALVEYSIVALDDFLRGFQPYLEAERFLSKEKLAGSKGIHSVWREVHSTESGGVTWLHRVFALPADAMEHPILEIHRQGASKRVWVQY